MSDDGKLSEPQDFQPQPDRAATDESQFAQTSQFEKALRESAELYGSLFENHHTVMLVYDPATFNIIDANPAACRYYGYSRAQLTALKITDLNGLSLEQVTREYQRARQSADQPYPLTHRLANGEWREVEAYASPIQLGGKTYQFSIVHDITGRKRAEVALQNERNFVSAVLDTVGALVVVFDRAGRIVRFNRACERVTGYTFAEVHERCFWDFLLKPEEIEPVKTVFMKLSAGNFPLNFENYWVTKDGRARLIAWSNTVLTGEDNVVEYLIGTGLDVTERRQAEQEIKHMSSFPLLNPNPVLEVDPAGNLVFCNPGAIRALQQLGIEPDAQLFLPVDFAAILREFEQSPALLQYREVAIAGAVFAESIYRAPDFGTLRIFATNITERKRAEEQLRYQAFLLENVSDAIVASDVNFIIQGWNKAAEEIYGWRAEEVVGKPVSEVLRGEFTVPVAETTRQLYAEGSWKGEVIHECKNGRRLHILASVRLLRDETGQPIGAVSANRDITDRKYAEQQLRESNAALQARNEELDAFAQTVAHDIKNPLHLIAGSAEVLNTYFDTQLSEDTVKLLGIIQKSAHKANSITDNLLLLSDVRRTVVCERLNMAEIVLEAQQRLAHLLEDNVHLNVPDTWPTALGYAPWVEEIWVNYLHNALKYAGRPLCLELGGQLQPDGRVRFWVRDNGVGISPEKQAHLFSISNFISRSRGGHGLGLSIVKRIAEKLGGEVSVQSSGLPGEGSTFSFTLPAA